MHVVADGDPGGGTTFVLGLCADLSRDFRCVLATQEGSYAWDAARQAGVETTGFDFFRSRLDVTLTGKLATMAACVRPALIHVHGARAANPFCRGELLDLPCKLLYTVHGYHFLQKPFPLDVAFKAAERRIAARADAMTLVSRADLRIASGFPGRTAPKTLIRNGVDVGEVDVVTPMAEGADVVFCARMCRQKNPLFAGDVFMAMPEPATMLVVGDGPLLARLRERVAPAGGRVRFLGALPRAEAVAAVKACKLMLAPSLWEGLPIGVLEAAAAEVPTIGSAVAGLDEAVADGFTGRLMPRFHAGEWAAAADELLRHYGRRGRMGMRARARVEHEFSRKAASEGYRRVYADLLAG
jgi:glycosyltransferase involved in cell wall biosynthesis